MKRTLLLSAWLFASLFSFANEPLNGTAKRICGTMDNLMHQKILDPGLESRMKQIETFTKSYMVNFKNTNTSHSIITIPVVFHIVYNNPSENISDAQCQAQVNQLNLDFAKMNTDASNIPAVWQGIAANTNIQFCLAQRDPNGLATTGVERRSSSTTSFTTDDKIKYQSTGGMNAWPSSSYLNIWSANLSGSILGYAQFPGGPATTDGVVLLFSSIGSMIQQGTLPNFNLGRTATHEVGHWLNLMHIWGDDAGCTGSDNVGDTPNQGTENYGCPSFPLTDGCSPSSPGVMFMNYMDYTDDACMNMFSSGQSTRMNALFANGGARVSISNSTGCQAPVISSTCGVATGLSFSSVTASGATLTWGTVSGAVKYYVKYKKSSFSSWSIISSTTNSKTITNLSSNTLYQWQVQAICSMGGGASSVVSTFTTAAAPACGIPSSLSSSLISANGATLNWSAVGGAISYNIQYQVNGSGSWINTTSNTNSKSLTGLTNGTSYTFQVQAICASGTGSYSLTSSFITLFANCTDNNEPNDSYLTPAIVATNADISGQISMTTDADWFGFTTSAPNTKFMIVLSNLVKDYNIRLYNSSFAQIGFSLKTGTVNDTIKKNLTAAGTYYIKVFGNNGAYSATQCYNLRVNISNVNFRLADEMTNVETIPLVQTDLTVFPNPIHDNLNVIFKTTNNQTATIRVYDMVGKIVRTIPLDAIEGENKLNIDFSEFHKGIYFVELIDSGNKITKKVILE